MSTSTHAGPRRGGIQRTETRQSIFTNGDSAGGAQPADAASSIAESNEPVERKCVLWIHDEQFSKEEVVFNLSLLAPYSVQPGQLMSIVALKTETTVRDFQDRSPPPKRGIDSLAASLQLDASVSELKSPRGSLSTDGRHDIDIHKQYLFAVHDMSKEMKSKHPNLEVSVAKHVADAFGFKHRSNVLLMATSAANSTASHVEITFKDEYLSRSDMWRLTLSELSNKTVYKGQKILFIGTVKASVTAVFVAGRKVQSAFYSSNTKPIFRSASARFVLFIQMSKEMWDFDSEGSGDIMFTKVVNGFLPALFKRWVTIRARHLVSIVLFTRMEYDIGLTQEMDVDIRESNYYTGYRDSGSRKPFKDFYRVVVSEMASVEWTTILYQLKREFRSFRRDVTMHRLDTTVPLPKEPSSGEIGMGSVPGTRIEAEPTFASHGNVLEAINLASSQYSQDHIDRDLVRTGISIVIISPGSGLFEVDHETLRRTTETLIANGIGIDLVCLPKMPLHSVPLFRYRNPQFLAHQNSLRLKVIASETSTPHQSGTAYGSFTSTLNGSLSPSKASSADLKHRLGLLNPKAFPDEWSFAIPNWLDVSFWTGASQDLLSRPVAKLPRVYRLRRRIVKARKRFAIRCKMYDVEMLGSIENVEIKVAPLPESLHLSSIPVQTQKSSEHQKELKRHAGLSDVVLGPIRSVVDRRSTLVEREFFERLEIYDEGAATRSETLKHIQSKLDLRKQSKKAFEKNAKKLLAEDANIFGTAFSNEKQSMSGLSLAEASLSARKRHDFARGAENSKPGHESVTSAFSGASTLSPTKSAKVVRQISFGNRGFGIAAPKASVPELQTENANAARTSNKAQQGNMQPSISTAMANHLLSPPRSDKALERPTSSQGSLRSTKDSNKGSDSLSVDEIGKMPTARPIAIKIVQAQEGSSQTNPRSILGSVYEAPDAKDEILPVLQNFKSSDSLRESKAKLLAGAVAELPMMSPTTALSPWLNVLNPSNPTVDDSAASQYKRWQHVFPRPLQTKDMKWKSLCSPASVPLTTESFPTKHQLDTEYQQKPYNVSQDRDDDMSEVPANREVFLRELISLRLSQGFQIVIGSAVAEAFGQKQLKIANLFDGDQIAEDGASVFMTLGNDIHQLSCVNGTEVEVNMFIRKATASSEPSDSDVCKNYNPAVRTTLESIYESRLITLVSPAIENNWNYVDSFLAGHDEEMSESLRYWRARFVLIPVERHTNMNPRGVGDTDEEIRLEGIKALTQIWQRYRYIPPSERRFQSAGQRKKKDPNPLDVAYRTQDPSVVVSADRDTLSLLEIGGPQIRRGQLLFEGYRFRRASLNTAALAEAIQLPVEKGGVRMQNRRWHFQLHYNCFIGSDMTTWMLENFEDIETREEAIELGNLLMTTDDERVAREREQVFENSKEKEKDKNLGIFVHVSRRHHFRDGHYYYQVVGHNAKPRPETRGGWPFGPRRRDTSVPSTPMSETPAKDFSKPQRARPDSNNDEKLFESGITSAPATGGARKRVALSKVMKYDVDPRKRSYRVERINLHYDRLHNPDNCYRIRLDWMNVTAKLIEDAIQSWATTAERHGLRLVELPIGEACSITSSHPFRVPYHISLAVQPPAVQPPVYFDSTSLVPQVSHMKHVYQRAILKRHNFVLDTEAASNFPSTIDVTYSWGRPDYKYTQYIHRSGIVLAQIDDDGNLLLLANKLFNNRSVASREQERFIKPGHMQIVRGVSNYSAGGFNNTPASSPALRATLASPVTNAMGDLQGSSSAAKISTPESIKEDLEAFCKDAGALEAFYTDVMEKPVGTEETPGTLTKDAAREREAGLEGDIPVLALELPRGLVSRDGSPLRLGPLPMGRRADVSGATGEVDGGEDMGS